MFCALVNGEGEVTDFLRLPHFTKRRNAWREEEREKKVSLGTVHVLRLMPAGRFWNWVMHCGLVRNSQSEDSTGFVTPACKNSAFFFFHPVIILLERLSVRFQLASAAPPTGSDRALPVSSSVGWGL